MAGKGLGGPGLVGYGQFGKGFREDGVCLHLHPTGGLVFAFRKKGEGMGGDVQFAIVVEAGFGAGLASALATELGAEAGGALEFASERFGSSFCAKAVGRFSGGAGPAGLS